MDVQRLSTWVRVVRMRIMSDRSSGKDLAVMSMSPVSKAIDAEVHPLVFAIAGSKRVRRTCGSHACLGALDHVVRLL